MGGTDGHMNVEDALAALAAHRASAAPRDMRAAFAADPDRFNRFSAAFGDLLLDWSKCSVTTRTMELLTGACRGRRTRAQARRHVRG